MAVGNILAATLEQDLYNANINTPNIAGIISQCMNTYPPDAYYQGRALYYTSDQEQRVVNCVYAKVISASAGDVINRINNEAGKTVTAVNDFSNAVNGALQQSQDITLGNIQEITDNIGDALAETDGQVIDISNGLLTVLNDLSISFLGNLNLLRKQTEEAISNQQAFSTAELQGLIAQIGNAIGSGASETSDVLEQFLKDNENTAQAVRELITLLKQGAQKAGESDSFGSLTGLLTSIAKVVSDLAVNKDHDTFDQAARIKNAVLAGVGDDAYLKQFFEGSFGLSAVNDYILSLFGTFFLAMPMLQAPGQPRLASYEQYWWANNPTKLLPLEVYYEAAKRNETLRQAAYDKIKAGGVALSELSYLDTSTEPKLSIAELADARFRGLIGDEDFIGMLRSYGWGDKALDLINQLTEIIPPISDLITMAVREAFSPDVAAKFGQFDDFPEDFGKWASKKGLTEDWSKRYWAMHWNLPSPTMGFEMFHRGIITDEELDILMRALDIMPFWRDKLKQLNYRVLDKVDIRRMHALGLLNHEDLIRAYLDDGYNQRDSERLAQFTEQYNDEFSRLGKDKDLTEAQVRRFYTEGLLDDEEALARLDDLKYSELDAKLILDSIKLEEAAKDRKAAIDTIVYKATKHVITQQEAEAALTQLNLRQREYNMAVSRILRSKAAQAEIPSQAQLKDMFNAKIIDEETYRQGLAGHGLNQVWIDRTVKMAKGG